MASQPSSGAVAWGAGAVRVVLPGRRGHGAEGLLRNIDYLNAALGGLGLSHATPRAGAIETELAEGRWLTLEAEAPMLFDVPPVDRWSRAMEAMGIAPSWLSAQSAHA